MRDVITTLLDLLGLLLVAAGTAAAAAIWGHMGWASLLVAGVVVLAGSRLVGWLGRAAAASPAKVVPPVGGLPRQPPPLPWLARLAAAVTRWWEWLRRRGAAA